jgi:hypothetical protein
VERSDVGHRAERNQIEQGEQVRLGPRVEQPALAQHPHGRHREQKGDPDRGKVAMRRGLVAFVEPVGIDQREGRGQLGRAFVMIDHHHVDPGFARHAQRFKRHCPAIDRDDQPRSFTSQPHQRLARWAIALKQPVGDVGAGIEPEIAQQSDQQCRAGRAVDIVIAVNRDLLPGEHRLGQSLGGSVHVAQQAGIGQERAQRGVAVALDILGSNTPGEQELGDQVVFKPGSRAGIERHVARPPAPDAPGKRFVDAKNGGKGGAHRAGLADRADEQKNRANFDVGK